MFCPFTKENCKSNCAFYVSPLYANGTTCLIADKLKHISTMQDEIYKIIVTKK